MKIQCPCGTKCAFDVTPEMATNPVQFICPNCGLDSSPLVNRLIRQELGLVVNPPPSDPPAAAARPPTVRVSSPVKPAPTSPAVPAAPARCFKHAGQVATHQCLVCQKPICPQCMAQFGYVCSAYCKTRAENEGIAIPVYEHQRNLVEAKQWRKTGRIAGAIAAVVVALLGFWFWYAWFGALPRVMFSVRFPERARSGQVRLCGQDQIVFLHGGLIARYDLKQKKEIWSVQLIDLPGLTNRANAEFADLQKENASRLPLDRMHLPTLDRLIVEMKRDAAVDLHLQISGQSVWVVTPDKLVGYDWDSGKASREIPFGEGFRNAHRTGDELVLTAMTTPGFQTIKHVNLANGETTTEQMTKASLAALVAKASTNAAARAGTNQAAATGAAPGSTAARIIVANTRPADQPLDPAAVAARAPNMSFPARLALPATLSAAANQQRLAAELNGDSDVAVRRPPATRPVQEFENVEAIPAADGPVLLTVKLIEQRFVEREAMKAPPKQSALNATTTAANSAVVANVWQDEVIGPVRLYPLHTVDVLVSGTTAHVLDHQNKKLWESKLNFPVVGGGADEGPDSGTGPCVERGDMLYIADQGVLSCFDLSTGNARWRLPSVGIAALIFDDKGGLYVNTTTAGPESIKYSKQIDLMDQTTAVVLKMDPKTGKTLWSAPNVGHVGYVWGKYIFTVITDEGNLPDDELGAMPVIAHSPFLTIIRLDAGNGRVLWRYGEKRCPIDVQFNRNTIQILYQKEMQHLKFLAL
jgi:hypothetical protein